MADESNRLTLTPEEWDILMQDKWDRDDDDEDLHPQALPSCCSDSLRGPLERIQANNGIVTARDKLDLLNAHPTYLGYHGRDEWDMTLLDRVIEEVKAMQIVV